MALLKWSRHCMPFVSHGDSWFVPSSMSDGSDRLHFLDGMLAFVGLWLAEQQRDGRKVDRSFVQSFFSQIPFALNYLDIHEDERGFVALEKPNIRLCLSFFPEHLSVGILDARERPELFSMYQSGVNTPYFSKLVSSLCAGTSRAELSALIGRDIFDVEEVLQGLEHDSALEEHSGNGSDVEPRFSETGNDRLTWLGHAGFLLQSHGATVCIDPWIFPPFVWRNDELQHVFSDDFADGLFIENCGLDFRSLSVQQLPRPDVICLTHQDQDHVDPGTLMMFPEDVPIIVPRKSPDRPWEADIKSFLENTLGPWRTIIELGHGESYHAGNIRVTAFPFTGEMPKALPLGWNCYLFQTPQSAVVHTADSRVTDRDIEFIAAQLSFPSKPLTLLARAPTDSKMAPGFWDNPGEIAAGNLWGLGDRLGLLYSPLNMMFSENQNTCVTYEWLERLSQSVNFKYFMPSAAGCVPWLRFPAGSPLHRIIYHTPREEIFRIVEQLGKFKNPVRLFPGKYGRPADIR